MYRYMYNDGTPPVHWGHTCPRESIPYCRSHVMWGNAHEEKGVKRLGQRFGMIGKVIVNVAEHKYRMHY